MNDLHEVRPTKTLETGIEGLDRSRSKKYGLSADPTTLIQTVKSAYKGSTQRNEREHSDATLHLQVPGGQGMYTDLQCKDEMCSEFLSEWERREFDNCIAMTRSMEWKVGPIHRSNCRFMNSSAAAGTFPLALVSFPGSGNTWVRGLLERATGICTGTLKQFSRSTLKY